MVNIRMIVFSVLYVSFAVLSIDVLGTTGLILANCFSTAFDLIRTSPLVILIRSVIDMLLRIVVNGWFIRRYFEVMAFYPVALLIPADAIRLFFSNRLLMGIMVEGRRQRPS